MKKNYNYNFILIHELYLHLHSYRLTIHVYNYSTASCRNWFLYWVSVQKETWKSKLQKPPALKPWQKILPINHNVPRGITKESETICYLLIVSSFNNLTRTSCHPVSQLNRSIPLNPFEGVVNKVLRCSSFGYTWWRTRTAPLIN